MNNKHKIEREEENKETDDNKNINQKSSSKRINKKYHAISTAEQNDYENYNNLVILSNTKLKLTKNKLIKDKGVTATKLNEMHNKEILIEKITTSCSKDIRDYDIDNTNEKLNEVNDKVTKNTNTRNRNEGDENYNTVNESNKITKEEINKYNNKDKLVNDDRINKVSTI